MSRLERIELFWSKVDRNGPVVPYVGTPCWIWTGAKSGTYGVFAMDGEKVAHRVSWTLENGAIPDWAYVCHRCDCRTCVRPDHLFLGTAMDNAHDAMNKGRRRSRLPSYPNRKLSDQQVSEILSSSESNTALADRYDVGKQTISNIRNGRTWKHLPPNMT